MQYTIDIKSLTTKQINALAEVFGSDVLKDISESETVTLTVWNMTALQRETLLRLQRKK